MSKDVDNEMFMPKRKIDFHRFKARINFMIKYLCDLFVVKEIAKILKILQYVQSNQLYFDL